jgi:tRNA A-37 threonylcarbamoyl transferase component Bud32
VGGLLREGEVLNDTYRLVQLVAEGGMGVVYEATHARLAGRYAIKVMTQRLAESSEGLAQLNREARITSLLQHPNIVQVIDHNTTPDGTEYLVMEYLAGESLSERLARERRLSLEAVVDVIDQMAAGLSAAHGRGVVHRDLKPDNVFLVPVEGRQAELVKILDFGISKRTGSLKVSGMVCGTPQYMAPEQVEGRVLDIDASTDQFALAVIAHEMLTGCNPFQADTVEAIFARVSAHVPPPVGFGAAVDAVLGRALEKSSALRFASVADFSEAFRDAARAWSRDNPVAAAERAADSRVGDLGRSEQKPRWRRRWTVTAGAAATMIAALLVAERRPNHLVTAGRAWSATLSARLRPDHGAPVQVLPSVPPTAARPRADAPTTEAIAPPQVILFTASEPPPPRLDERASPGGRARQPARSRSASPPKTARPRPVLPADEDATMPPSELSGLDADQHR